MYRNLIGLKKKENENTSQVSFFFGANEFSLPCDAMIHKQMPFSVLKFNFSALCTHQKTRSSLSQIREIQKSIKYGRRRVFLATR
jgi:hypothetical protein